MDLPRLEQGTGIATALAMMIAEEANVPLSKVRVRSADAQPELLYNQITGGSCSVRAFEPMLPAMVLAARLKAGLPPQAGRPVGPVAVQGDRQADAQARCARHRHRPQEVHLGPGRAGRRPTMCRMPSTVRGSVQSVNNRDAVLAMPRRDRRRDGPRRRHDRRHPAGRGGHGRDLRPGLGRSPRARHHLGPGCDRGESNATIWNKCRAAIPPQLPAPPGTLSIDAEFTWKAATACPLEVECAIVDATNPARAEIWAGLQSPIVTTQAIALDLGLPLGSVIAHCIPSGGAFGRRLFWDPVQVAAQISKKTGRICKLMYHRSDDIRTRGIGRCRSTSCVSR